MNNLQERLRISNETPKPGEFWRLGFKQNDGGRKEAGYKGDVSDCVTRAMALVIQLRDNKVWPEKAYQATYDRIYQLNEECFNRKRKKTRKNAPKPYDYTYKKVTKQIMKEHGGEWNATMEIGSGCQVHMRADELPSGLLVLNVSKHVTVVHNHVIYDTHNPDRDGTRCVYGYWKFETE